MSEIVAGLFQSFDGVMESADCYHDQSFSFPQTRLAKPVRGAATIPNRFTDGADKSLRDEPDTGQAFTTYQPPTNGFGSSVPRA